VSVLFAHICDFDEHTAHLSPQQIVALLNKVFSKFDELTDMYDVYKVETIGDVYLVASGCPREFYRPDHAAILSVVATAMHRGTLLFFLFFLHHIIWLTYHPCHWWCCCVMLCRLVFIVVQ
jgi:class 3 adenylate cyclase